MRRIVITGGHHNSALVVAQKLRKKGFEVIWFGHKYTMWEAKEVGAEYKEVSGAGFKFVEIKAGKFHRTYNPVKLLRIPFGFFQSFYFLLKVRPKMILSFGGYLAVPVVICGWLLGIPIITHEQTAFYGLANKLISHFAKKIFVSWEVSLKHFPSQKTIWVGLPLREEIFADKKGRFDFGNKMTTIYITGGKQGSHIINQAVEECLPALLGKYNLIHQCGSSTIYDDLSRLTGAKEKLSPELQKRYLVCDYILSKEIGHVFASADLIVSRSGAHTVYEVAALGKPALFIPIPWTAYDEQTKNAQMLVSCGLAEILLQKNLSGEVLLEKISEMMANLENFRKNAQRVKKLIKLDGAEKLVKELDELVKA